MRKKQAALGDTASLVGLGGGGLEKKNKGLVMMESPKLRATRRESKTSFSSFSSFQKTDLEFKIKHVQAENVNPRLENLTVTIQVVQDDPVQDQDQDVESPSKKPDSFYILDAEPLFSDGMAPTHGCIG